MQDGLVYVDGQVQPEPWLPTAYRDSANMPPDIVPAGDVWVLGDHRAIREDRSKFGPIPVRSIAGEVRLVWCPWPTSGCCRRGDPARGPTPAAPQARTARASPIPWAAGCRRHALDDHRHRRDLGADGRIERLLPTLGGLPARRDSPPRRPVAHHGRPPPGLSDGVSSQTAARRPCASSGRTEPGSQAGRSWRKRLEGAPTGLSARRGWPAPHPPRPARGQPLAATG